MIKDECPISADLYLKDPDSPEPYLAHAAFFKLVTPVEELEPYSVEKTNVGYRLIRGDELLANYWPNHPYAKEAAEAERDRLNAEYRKEQEK